MRGRRKRITIGTIMRTSARDRLRTVHRNIVRLRWMALAVACSFVSAFGCASNYLGPSPVRGPLNWENEPAGFTTLTEWAFDQAPPTSGDVSIPGSNGWKINYNVEPGSRLGGWVTLASDSSAPVSRSSVYDFVYPQGMVEGTAPGTVYYPFSPPERALYAGFYWKASNPFDTGTAGNKIAFIFNGGGGAGGQQFIILKPDGLLHVLPEYVGDVRWRSPNVNATRVTLGVWHRIEWYSNLDTGVNKWWLDGLLQGSYTDVVNTYPFDMFQFSATFGGCCSARKAETDHYWFDHVRVSGPGVLAPSRITRAGGG